MLNFYVRVINNTNDNNIRLETIFACICSNITLPLRQLENWARVTQAVHNNMATDKPPNTRSWTAAMATPEPEEKALLVDTAVPVGNGALVFDVRGWVGDPAGFDPVPTGMGAVEPVT